MRLGTVLVGDESRAGEKRSRRGAIDFVTSGRGAGKGAKILTL